MDNLYKVPLSNIAKDIGRSENAVKLFLYRKKIPLYPEVKVNLIRKLLDIKMGNSEYFQPTREFFDQVGIGQKRWGKLFFGYEQATEKEILSVARHFKLNTEESFALMDCRQLDIFNQ